MIMGVATFLVALVPTYDSIGIWGAVILNDPALHSRRRRWRRVGWFGPDVDGVGALRQPPRLHRVLAAVPSALRSLPCKPCHFSEFSQMSGEQFLTWGWRLPFFLSLILVGIGLYIRLGILETPGLSATGRRREEGVERTPPPSQYAPQREQIPAPSSRPVRNCVARGRPQLSGWSLQIHRALAGIFGGPALLAKSSTATSRPLKPLRSE